MRALQSELGELRELAAERAYKPHVRELVVHLDRLLSIDRPNPIEAVDSWGYPARDALDELEEPERTRWVRVLIHARDATGSKPSAGWLKRARPLVEALNPEAYAELTATFLDLLGEQTYDEAYPSWLEPVPSETNAAILKGLAWLSTLGETRRLAGSLATAAIRCFAKVPGAGPRAIAVGNACVYALGTLEPAECVRHLPSVRLRVTYLPAVKLVDAALEAAAGRAGLTRDDLEELTVPTLGLEAGRSRTQVGAYDAEVAVDGSRVEVVWSKDGAVLRSEPAAARRVDPDATKRLKAAVQELRAQLSIVRDRLERALMTGREWPLAAWRERYLDQALVSALAHRLIW